MSAPSDTFHRLVRPTPASRWSPLVVTGAFALGALCALVIANGLARGVMFYPQCSLKWLTGIPCPGCGGTRCLAALSQGDWITALVMNPLVAVGAGVAWLSVPLAWFDVAARGGRGAAVVGRLVRSRWFGWTMAAVVAGNWVWLCLEGR